MTIPFTPMRPIFGSVLTPPVIQTTDLETPPAEPQDLTTNSIAESTQLSKPILNLQPATPNPSQGVEFSKMLGGVSGLAARRSKNMKMLSLVVPSLATTSLNSPTTPSAFNITIDDIHAETRSLPPSPSIIKPSVLLTSYVGIEGTEEEDRTIGRLMMKQQVDEMREQMKGGRTMSRRKSIPRLVLSDPSTREENVGISNGAAAVRLIRRDNRERQEASSSSSHPSNSSNYSDSVQASSASSLSSSPLNNHSEGEIEEQFPYENGPREILPGIYLGSELNARDPQVLTDWDIGWVLNVAKEVVCPWTGEETLEIGRNPTPMRSPITPRPLFIRPTSSTPNLSQAYKSASTELPSPILEDASPLPTPNRLLPSSPSDTMINLPPYETFPRNAKTNRPEVNYLWLKWGHDESDLVEAGKFQKAFDFIDVAKENGGNILIQCQCGVSRSATVMIAYCMREASRMADNELLCEPTSAEIDMTGEEEGGLGSITGMHSAYSFVKEKSQWVGPNLNLVFQLVSYERNLRGAAPTDSDDDQMQEAEHQSSLPPPPIAIPIAISLPSPTKIALPRKKLSLKIKIDEAEELPPLSHNIDLTLTTPMISTGDRLQTMMLTKPSLSSPSRLLSTAALASPFSSTFTSPTDPTMKGFSFDKTHTKLTKMGKHSRAKSLFVFPPGLSESTPDEPTALALAVSGMLRSNSTGMIEQLSKSNNGPERIRRGWAEVESLESRKASHRRIFSVDTIKKD